MTAPDALIEMAGVSRHYGSPQPFRMRQLTVMPDDRLAISGFDQGAAETFVLLVTGAALPEEGAVRVAGRDTREIATDTEWLSSLDRFGIVTNRAVLIDALPIVANMALPMTLSIEPVPDDVLARVRGLAEDVGLSQTRLGAATSTLTPDERVRVHLARALALDPAALLLEHPTVGMSSPAATAELGTVLQRVTAARRIAWVALSDDEAFSRASGGRRVRLDLATGNLRAASWRWPWSS